MWPRRSYGVFVGGGDASRDTTTQRTGYSFVPTGGRNRGRGTRSDRRSAVARTAPRLRLCLSQCTRPPIGRNRIENRIWQLRIAWDANSVGRQEFACGGARRWTLAGGSDVPTDDRFASAEPRDNWRQWLCLKHSDPRQSGGAHLWHRSRGMVSCA